MSRKSSTPSSLTFEESDQNDALMKHIFENFEDVPEEETPPEQTSHKKSDSSSTSGTKPSSFNKGASKQKEAAGKNTNTKVSPVKKSDAGSVWGKLPKK